MADLFSADPDDLPGEGNIGGDRLPLAVRMRPRTLAELVGQEHLLAPGSPLHRLAEGADGVAGPASLILWGPPGSGKTTLAHVVSQAVGRRFVELSAITAGVKDVRRVMEDARDARDLHGQRTVLFLDEIHRFTKAQQDALLPGVENRWVILVAATTENPSFSVVAPLLSRSLLLTLRTLDDNAIGALVRRAVTDPRGLGGRVRLSDEAAEHLVRLAAGDARRALTALEAAAGSALDDGVTRSSGARGLFSADQLAEIDQDTDVDHDAEIDQDSEADQDAEIAEDGEVAEDSEDGEVDRNGVTDPGSVAGVEPDNASGEASSEDADPETGPPLITLADAERAVDRAAVRYDRDGDQHYDIASALIKSLRGSDVDAALHYVARMLEAGEDPRFVARRLVIAASEEIGMADPTALQTAVAAAQAVQLIGMPEARIVLGQATVHLAMAPKSNAAYLALNAAIADVRAGLGGAVPIHLRDSHYSGAGKLGHGRGYQYAHDDPRGVVSQQYAPDDVVGRNYYAPTERGAERGMPERLARLRAVLRAVGKRR
jgi:putative ATPase